MIDISKQYVAKPLRPIVSQIERLVQYDQKREKITISRDFYNKLMKFFNPSGLKNFAMKYKGVLIECA